MDFFFNDYLNKLVTAFGSTFEATESVAWKRRDFAKLNFLPFDGSGFPQKLALPGTPGHTELIFAIKAADDYGGDPLASTDEFTYSSTSGMYSGEVDLGSVQIAAEFLEATGITSVGVANTQLVAAHSNRLLTGTGQATLTGVTSASATDLLTTTGTAPETGQPFVIEFNSGFTGLTSGTTYYAINVSGTTFKAATTRANALAGTAINITASSTGATVYPVQAYVVPLNATESLPVAFKTWVIFSGTAGSYGSIIPETSGVTITATDTSATLAAGVPVLLTKTGSDAWSLTVPVELPQISVIGEFTWRNTSLSTSKPKSTPTLQITIDNDIWRGNENNPSNTSEPSLYYTKTQVDSAIAAEATLRDAADDLEASNRAAAFSTEAATRSAADTALQAQITAMKPYLAMASSVGATVTLALTHANKTIEAAQASPTTITIPLNSSVAFPLGTRIRILRRLSSPLTVSGISGVTLYGLGVSSNSISLPSNGANGGVIEIEQTATNEWQVIAFRTPTRYEIQQAESGLQTLTDASISGGGVSWDMANGHNVALNFSALATRVLNSPSNMPPAGAKGIIIVKQDSVGSRTISFNAIFVALNASITLNTAANSKTRIDWFYDGTNILLNKA